MRQGNKGGGTTAVGSSNTTGRSVLAALGLAVAGMASQGASAEGVGAVQWEYRPLLLFTPSADDAELSRQTTMLADAKAGLMDRRVAVYIVQRNRVYTAFGAPSPGAKADRLRRHYRVPDDRFRAILVGLDGSEKYTSDDPIPMATLFATIDGMPMRRRELRERGAQ